MPPEITLIVSADILEAGLHGVSLLPLKHLLPQIITSFVQFLSINTWSMQGEQAKGVGGVCVLWPHSSDDPTMILW